MKDTRKASRILTAILAAAMMTSLAACGGDAGVTETADPAETTAPAETTEYVDPATISSLPDMDWGGQECRILGYNNTKYPQFSSFEIDVEAENGEVVNDAIFRRNTAIEERYNVDIVQILDATTTATLTSTLTHMRAMALAGEDLYDIAFCSVNSIGTAAREGLFWDLNELDYLDFSKEWWNQGVNETLTVSGRLFFTNSDFTLRDKNRTYLLLFNKRLAEEYKLDNYFDLVREGTWTLDKMTEDCKKVANDVNGNGEVDYYDVFGMTMDSYYGGVALAIGSGVKVLENVEGEFSLVVNNEHTINVMDDVISFITGARLGSSCEEWKEKNIPLDDYWDFSGTVYNEGRALFGTGFAHVLQGKSANSVDDYGILPFPKYDETQKDYHIYADPQGLLVGIPSTTDTPDFSAFMLEALSAEAYTTSLPAYIEVSCKTKYTYDEDSADMLDLIFGSIVFEPAQIYNLAGVGKILHDVCNSRTNSFVTKYASSESQAKADLEKLVDDILAVGK